MRNNFVKDILCLIFLILFTFALASATPQLPYLSDTVLPESENKLEIKGNARVDLFSGAALYSHPINVPPGTNNLAPKINLLYDSQSLGKRPGILGSSWRISESYIQRDTNYTFSNATEDNFKLVLEGSLHDMIYSTADGRYHTKIETFLYIKNETGGNGNDKNQYWIVKTKDGITYRFGYYNFSETLSNQYSYVWRWYLDLVNDTYGNQIFYNYSENPFPKDNGTVYLNKIQYNNDRKRVIDFVYENTDRQDFRTNFEEGNKITQSRRLREIIVNANNTVVRRYSFNYKIMENVNGSLSFLTNITEFGLDNVTSLPPVKFEYNKMRPGWNDNSSLWKLPSDVQFLSSSNTDLGVRLADVNGDGLLDILDGGRGPSNSCGDNEKKVYINNGTGWENSSWRLPICFTFYGDGEDEGARLADVNSDGLVDILSAKRGVGNSCQSNDKTAYINNGTGWVQNDSWEPPECFIYYSPIGQDDGLRMDDINGDGLIDFISGERSASNVCGDNEKRAYINNGNGWTEDDSREPPVCFVLYSPAGEDEGMRITEVNGDGLPDIIESKDGAGKNTYINNGTGWVLDNSTFVAPEWLVSDKDEGVRLADINGDGLVDFVKGKEIGFSCGDAHKIAYINNGTGWIEYEEWEPSLCFLSEGGSDRGVRLADIDGNGLIDILRAQEGYTNFSFVNNASKSYLLSNITTELGGIIHLDYEKSTHFSNIGNDTLGDLGFNIWVVSNITYNNGINSLHRLNYTSFYNYSSGLYHYKDKEFRGFGYVEEKISDKVTKHYFHQDVARKGREYKTEILNSQGNPYKTLQQLWNSEQQNNYYIVELNEEAELDFDGDVNNPQIKNTTYDYDAFGNIVYTHKKGDINNADDDRFEHYNYLNNSNAWIVDKAKNYSLIASDNSTVLRTTLYTYDGLEHNQEPIKGDVTKKEDVLDNINNPIINYSYNVFGNLVNETNPKEKRTEYIYGIEEITNTFPDKKINAKNQDTEYNYELGTGNLLNKTDSNKILTKFEYDELSIDEKTILPLDSPEKPTQNYEYDFVTADEGKIVVKQREESNEEKTLDTYRFYDGFGRLIQTRKEAENNKQIIVDTYYDKQGRVNATSNPYFSSFSAVYTAPSTTVNLTIYEYDLLDRVTKAINPDGTFKTINYTHWNITVFDENQNRKDYNLDAYNNIIKVIENNNGKNYTTNYEYNSANELVLITDSLGNNFSYIYDKLGRKISSTDPDRGTMNYTYDKVGNLIQQNDSKGNNLTIEYDELNRKTKEITGTLNRTYLYDINQNDTLFGVLIIPDKTIINYSYDNRSRKKEQNISIDGINWTILWTYDSLDRIITKKLPDKKVITNTYNTQGLINSTRGIIFVAYNEKDQTLNITYSNTLLSNYTYRADNFRLINIRTSNLQNLNYSYDGVGNIVGINDSANQKRYLMTYDDLDRLIITNISSLTSHDFLNYTYDEIGRITNLTHNDRNMTFVYDVNRPVHAPSEILLIIGVPNDINRFNIKDDLNNVVAWLGDSGNIVLEGKCYIQTACNPSATSNEFIIRNSSKYNMSYINSTGDLCITSGDCSSSPSCSPPTNRNNFIIRNISKSNVSYIDDSGDLCYTGNLYEESVSGSNYTLYYDQVGNLISGYGFNHSYNTFNELNNTINSITGALISEYRYNHEGQRIKKKDYNINSYGDNRTTYYIDESFIQIRITNGTIINESYYYVNGKLLVMEDNNNKMFYYHPDHLGSTSLVTNDTLDVVEEEFYLPYGGSLDGNEDSRFLFNSKEKDRTTGLYYYGARYYSPFASQFIQADSVILDIYNPQDLNRYAYVRNNPYKYTDPSGNQAEIIIGSIVITYAEIEATVDIISAIYSGILVAQDRDSNVNKLALAADITDLFSGPFSNPGPSGPIIRAGGRPIERGFEELVEQEIFDKLKDIEDKFRNKDDKNKKIEDKKEEVNNIDASDSRDNNLRNKLLGDSNNQYGGRPFSTTGDPGPDGVIYAYESRYNKERLEKTSKIETNSKVEDKFI